MQQKRSISYLHVMRTPGVLLPWSSTHPATPLPESEAAASRDTLVAKFFFDLKAAANFLFDLYGGPNRNAKLILNIL